MKRLSILAFLLLSGCAWWESHSDDVAKVQEYTKQICMFLPTTSSVAAMISASDPTVTGALAIATAICDMIARKPQALYSDLYTPDTCPKVNGVCIEGSFIKEEGK